jgi:hypothetical protein
VSLSGCDPALPLAALAALLQLHWLIPGHVQQIHMPADF